MPMFPTIQCPLWVDLDQQLITIAMTTLNLVLLDISGQVYIMLQAPEGSYPDTSVAMGTILHFLVRFFVQQVPTKTG